jgi:hypothetical protein
MIIETETCQHALTDWNVSLRFLATFSLRWNRRGFSLRSEESRVRRVTGEMKQRLMNDPAVVFDGIAGDVELSYSDRVTGIGEFEFAPVPKSTSDESGMGSLWAGLSTHVASVENMKEGESDEHKLAKRTLLIDTHEDHVRDAYREESEKARLPPQVPTFASPAALRPGFTLKKHQVAGLQCYRLVFAFQLVAAFCLLMIWALARLYGSEREFVETQ